MTEHSGGSNGLPEPVSYERWVLQYLDGLDLDNPYHETEFEKESEHLDHAEYMLYEALRGSLHYEGPVSHDNPLIPANVADVAEFYDSAVSLLQDLYTAVIPTDRYENGELGWDLAVYAGCERLQNVSDILEGDLLSGLVKSPFFVVGVAPERGLLFFRDRVMLTEIVCSERAELRRVHERIRDGAAAFQDFSGHQRR